MGNNFREKMKFQFIINYNLGILELAKKIRYTYMRKNFLVKM